MEIRIGVFIQSVSRHALRGASKSGPEGTNDEVVAPDRTKDNAFAHRLGSHGSAFRNFASMPGQPRWNPAQNWASTVQGRIAAASSKHKVSASLYGVLQGLE